MKVLINRKPVDGPWGGGNLLVRALCEKLPQYGIEIVHQFSDDIDIIFMQDPRHSDLKISVNEILKYKNFRRSVKIVHRVNECDARKGTEDMDTLLRECSKHTSHTIFVSNWMKEYHTNRGWFCGENDVIYNGVDLDHFQPQEKINNNKINIVTHHWSNNRMKGFDVYEAIDQFVGNNLDKFTFTYVGRELGTFKNATVISPKFGKNLGDELAQYDVYVSGTKFDPGPNHILESLACEIPTYVHSNSGGAVEFAGDDHTFNTIEQLFDLLKEKKFKKNSMIPYSWDACIQRYADIIEGL